MSTHISRTSAESGFGLVEALIATMMTAVGVLSVAVLFMVGARMQLNAKDGSTAVGLATWELERIRLLLPADAERADGGSLTADVANHFIVRGRTTLRWRIENIDDMCAPIGGVETPGVAFECAKRIVVVAVSPNDKAVSPEVSSILFR
jgi:hypothetical protein